MNYLAIIEGLISSVPEAIRLWQCLAPHIALKAEIPAEIVAEINSLIAPAHAAVGVAHQAINALVAVHVPGLGDPAPAAAANGAG